MKNIPSSKTVSEKLFQPFLKFAEVEASSGILLLLFTIIALFWANSSFSESYHSFWETKFTIGAGSLILSKSLNHWINDGLMAIFFFVVGLEIKREVLIGELASLKKSALPLFAALGGMVVPALIYLFLNHGKEGGHGWGIPMATDIAFALGVLTLLGKRVPVSLKIFLMALAIIDDIGAILVIAFFYTSQISWIYLALGAACLFLLFLCNCAGVRKPLIYAIIGIAGLWLSFLLSGIHATIAGVLAAFMIPATTRINSNQFHKRAEALIQDFKNYNELGEDVLTNQDQQSVVHDLEKSCEFVQTPLQRLEHALHPWVNYFIMPLFALANAGVALKNINLQEVLAHSVVLGIFFGLVFGKTIGILLFSWVVVKLKWAELPEGVSWKQMLGTATLGGIGFTMSLFIAGLAFEESNLLSLAKVGILLASFTAGIAGWLFLKITSGKIKI